MDDTTSISSIDFLSNSYGKNFLKRMSSQDRHAELFRKDLISAMKMPDSETLQPDDYFEIIDSWKLEWERGVQVPVNANVLTPRVIPGQQDMDDLDRELFGLPKKLLYSGSILDNTFKPSIHELYDLQKQVASTCQYDLDEQDTAWLCVYNQSRDEMDGLALSELDMERILEELEVQCHTKMNEAVRTIEGLGIEYDENVVCDICRSPEGEESNEMVFCDNCDICVHQACYGIQNIPEGSWLCRTCALGIKPKCVLCPMVGGAMKSTKNGEKWAHISCALWVPEVSIGCPEKMEPITNISQIPASRWTLLCTLCRERSGACIQCSVRSCKTSFHVTCAFKYGLDLSTVIDDDTEDVQMKAYCPKHSGVEGAGSNAGVGFPAGEGTGSDDAPDAVGKAKEGSSDRKSKRNKDGLTEEQRSEIRSQKLKRLAEEFYGFADARETSQNLGLPLHVVTGVLSYWTLKRKSRFDLALMPIKTGDEDASSRCQDEEKLLERMKMFIQLRQDLERVRNLCYMVNKREKMRRHLYRMKEEIFHRQAMLYTKFVDWETNKDGGVVQGFSGVICQRFSKRNFRLSDSDDDEDFDRSLDRNKDLPVAMNRARVSKYLKTIDSDDDNDEDFRSDDNDYGDDGNDKDDSRHSGKKETAKKREKDKVEERGFLMGAHKSTGTIYDRPSYVLTCSFKDNSFLNNDRSFMKSAVAAAVSRSVVMGVDDDDDEDEIFPKSFKYDMKIDEDYLDSFCSSSNTPATFVNKVASGRGRPRKNKRGRPSRAVSAFEELEDDDSDYYRRLSDKDFEEENMKLNSIKTTAVEQSPAPPPPEKKKRGRKRKSELTATAADKTKVDQQKSAEVPRKKRKYTRRKGIKGALAETNPGEERTESPLHASLPPEVVAHDRSLESLENKNVCDASLGSDTGAFAAKSQIQDVGLESEDEIIIKERATIFIDSDDEEEELDPELRARREKAAELLKDMEFSDSSTEEEVEFKNKDLGDNNVEGDDIIVYDVDCQDGGTGDAGMSGAPPNDETENLSPLAKQDPPVPVETNQMLLQLPPKLPSSPLFSSSSDESDVDDIFGEDVLSNKNRNNSKVTGVMDKELLNINARRKLIHQLPIKDFIVSTQIKNMVQNFFSTLSSSDFPNRRLAFNGFKLPQDKIECA